MTNWSRRGVILGASAVGLSACTGTASREGEKIDKRVAAQLAEMQRLYPQSTDLLNQAAGVLIMPFVGEASLGYGGAYGEGALQINGVSVDYYSVAEASIGLQIGLQKYSSALFFMNQDRLMKFRARDGWTLGADLSYTALDSGEIAAIDSNTYKDSVFALVFDQKGLSAGAAIEGSKYTRIVR